MPSNKSTAQDVGIRGSRSAQELEQNGKSVRSESINHNDTMKELEGKREVRNRKPVVWIQDQYDTIYATFRSRKRVEEQHATIEPIKRLTSVTSPQPVDTPKESNAEAISRSSSRLAAKAGDKRKQAESLVHQPIRKRAKMDVEDATKPTLTKIAALVRDPQQPKDEEQEDVNQGPSRKIAKLGIEEMPKSTIGKAVMPEKVPRRQDDEVNEERDKNSRRTRRMTGTTSGETPKASLDLPSDNVNQKKSHTDSDSKNNQEENEESMDLNGSQSTYDDIDEGLAEAFQQYPKAPIAEGSTTEGHIRVGQLHQAIVPSLITNREYKASRPDLAVKVWQSSKVSEEKLNSFLGSASAILTNFMKKNRFYSPPSNTLLRILVPRKTDTASEDRKTEGLLKEFQVDALLALFHEKSYNASDALNSIERSPEKFLHLWDKREQETFDIGFGKYFSNLRLIAKGFDDSKTHKDIVDYYYRHKIPEQFRRYQESKLLQARRMLQAVETRRIQELSNENREAASTGVDASSTRVDSSNSAVVNSTSTPAHVKKYRHWFGPVSSSELEKRRANVRDFLLLVNDNLGREKYNELMKCLGEYRSKDSDPVRIKGMVSRLFTNHSSLYKRFQEFLPQDLRK